MYKFFDRAKEAIKLRRLRFIFKIMFSMKRQPFKKVVIVEERLDDIDIDLPELLFIDEECGNPTIIE